MSTDLMETFWNAVEYFNNQNWDHLEPLLHVDIKMKRLDEPQSNIYHEGRKAVHDYFVLGNGKDDQAEFKPDKLTPPDYTQIGDYGFVSGAADFIGITNRNKDGPTDPRRIAYSATFKRGDDPENRFNWQVIHSWGKYEDKIRTTSK